MTICCRIFVGIVYGLLMRSWRCSFVFLFSFSRISILIHGIVERSGIRVNIMAWVDSSLMCRSWMCWRIWRRRWRFDTWPLSSILAPPFTYFCENIFETNDNTLTSKCEFLNLESATYFHIPSARAAGTSMRLSKRLSTLTQFLWTTRKPGAIPPQWRSL